MGWREGGKGNMKRRNWITESTYAKAPLNRREFVGWAARVATSLLLPRFAADAENSSGSKPRPNIVLIVSDDQGYADISCYAHPEDVNTPNLDRLAKEGVRLTNGYASAPVCAPTRAGLMTGRYQQRFGFYTASDSRAGMPVSEVTIARLLKQQGYVTGVIGKWHLGYEAPYQPLKRGFDEFYGFLGHGGHDYFDLKIKDPVTAIYRNGQPVDETGYLTQNFTREAVSFIERHHRKPFFLYLPYSAVHAPMQAPDEYQERFKTGDKKRDTYLAMLACMDDGIGEVLGALQRTRVDNNTLIFFLSDNGGAVPLGANNGVLRAGKHSLYEGGIRVPFISRWPGQLPAGTVCTEPVICQDVFTTILAAAGVKPPGDRIIDGKNMLPVLRGETGRPLHESLFWAWLRPNKDEEWAIRRGKWKLLSGRGNIELYDLEADISETRDLARQKPELVKELTRIFEEWRGKMVPQIKRRRRESP
jgi:arylsulfatase A-like enzyme